MKLPKIDLKKTFSTRAFRVGGYSVAATAIVIAIAVAVNLLAGALPSTYTQLDATSTQLYTLSDQTAQIVSGLEQEVTLYWLVRSGYEDSTIGTLLDRYDGLSDKLQVVKKDPDVYPTFAAQYTDSSITDNSVLVVSGERSRYVDYNELYEMDYYSYYYYGTYSYTFYGETELTSAIDYCLSADLPKVYTLTGHGESSLSTTFSSAVEKENIETEELSLLTLEAVPEDADCVLIYCPQSDISEEEAQMLLAYLQAGGSLYLITDPPADGALTNLEGLMASYGVQAAEGIVVEGSASNYAAGRPYYLLPEYGSHEITSPLSSGGYYVLLPIAQGLTVSDTLSETVTVTQLLTTSADAYSKIAGYGLTTYDREDGDINGPFALAVAITDTIDDETSANIVWVSSGAIADDTTSAQVSGGNQDFFLNALSYLCAAEESGLSIHAKTLSTEYLTMDSATSSVLSLLVIGLIPAVYLAIGIIVVWRRKRK